MENLLQELEKTKETVRFYEVTKLLNPPDRTPLQLNDANQQLCTNAHKIAEDITAFYEKFFNPEDHTEVKVEWETSEPLMIPITKEEVEAAAKKLRNGRACGKDQIPGELLKYGGDELHEQIAELINGIFTNKSSLTAIGEGLLMPLKKPGKPRTADNTRAITLLNTI